MTIRHVIKLGGGCTVVSKTSSGMYCNIAVMATSTLEQIKQFLISTVSIERRNNMRKIWTRVSMEKLNELINESAWVSKGGNEYIQWRGAFQ